MPSSLLSEFLFGPRKPAGRGRNLHEAILCTIPATIDSTSGAITTYRNGTEYRRQMRLTGDTIRQNIGPTVSTVSGSVEKYVKVQNWIGLFQTFLNTANVVNGAVTVLAGIAALQEIGCSLEEIHDQLQAQVGLDAPEKFATHVNKYIRQMADSLPRSRARHYYFLYHPDTDWHPEFFDLVGKKSLPSHFLGMSDNLHAICAWMAFLRTQFSGSGKKAEFHLLIPSYRPLAIKQPFIFDENLLPLTVYGHIHGTKPDVWLNLPTMVNTPVDQFELKGVGNIATLPERPTFYEKGWEMVSSLLTSPKKPDPVVLGQAEAVDTTDAESSDDQGYEDAVQPVRGPFDVHPDTHHVSRSRRRHRGSRQHH